MRIPKNKLILMSFLEHIPYSTLTLPLPLPLPLPSAHTPTPTPTPTSNHTPTTTTTTTTIHTPIPTLPPQLHLQMKLHTLRCPVLPCPALILDPKFWCHLEILEILDLDLLLLQWGLGDPGSFFCCEILDILEPASVILRWDPVDLGS